MGDNAQASETQTESRIPADDKRRKGNLEGVPDSEYICIPRPLFDYTSENSASDEPLEEDEVQELYSEDFGSELTKNLRFMPADEHPEWKWIMTAKAAVLEDKYGCRATYCNPDCFQMYIYNDFHGYGIQELIENMLLEFNTAYIKKNNEGVDEMWAIMTAMGWWLSDDDHMPWLGSDISDKISETLNLIGAAFLEALNSIDLLGELKADSKFKDLGLVMSIFLHWPDDLEEYGIEGKYLSWRKLVVAYMKKAGITADKGVFGTAELVEKSDQGADTSAAKVKRWGFASKLKTFKSRNGQMGGRHYDITKWTSKKRKDHSYDGKDVLAHLPPAMLKNDGLRVT